MEDLLNKPITSDKNVYAVMCVSCDPPITEILCVCQSKELAEEKVKELKEKLKDYAKRADLAWSELRNEKDLRIGFIYGELKREIYLKYNIDSLSAGPDPVDSDTEYFVRKIPILS